MRDTVHKWLWTIGCRRVERLRLRGRGRGRKTWQECVTDDMKRLGVTREAAQDRAVCKGDILGSRLTCASADVNKNRRKTKKIKLKIERSIHTVRVIKQNLYFIIPSQPAHYFSITTSLSLSHQNTGLNVNDKSPVYKTLHGL